MEKSRFTSLSKHRAALYVIILGILIRIPLVLLPYNYLNDPWRPADTASIARHFAENGFRLFYPQIYWGGAGPGYVEAEFQFYPFIVALLYKLFGEQFWLGKLVSLLFSIGAAVAFYALARRLFKPWVALWALVFFVISPMYLQYSVEYMPEATMFFFYVSALYLFHRWLDDQRLLTLLLAGVSTALAILIKPTSIHIGLVFLLLLLERYRLRAFTKWPIWLFALISLLPGGLWYLHARNLYLEYGNTFGVISGGDSKFGNVLSYWLSPGFYRSLASIEINFVLTTIGAVLFLWGFALYLRKRENSLLLFGTITVPIYYMIIPRYTGSDGMGLQYHIFFVPYAALAIGIGWAWLFGQLENQVSLRNFIQSRRALIGLASMALIVIASGRYYRNLMRPVAQERVDCAVYVAALVPETDRIVVSTTSLAHENGVPNNYQEPLIFFISRRYGWSLAADQLTPEQLDEFRRDGAKYFVIYSPRLYEENPALSRYLESNAEQIGPGIEDNCGIYWLKPSVQQSMLR